MRFLHIIVLVICTVMLVNGGVVSADVTTDIQTLQTLVQQQAAAISTLQATVSSLQAEVSGLKNNVQTLSKPVAFTARFKSDEVMNGIHLTRHQTLVFDNVITNAGNGYNSTTGIFTSPLAGYYAFSIVAMEPRASNPSLALGVVKNGDLVDEIWVTNNPNAYEEQGSTHSVIHLAAGDKVWIRQEESGVGVRGQVFTVFTGYLVHVE